MRKEKIGIPWWSSGKDSVLLLLGAQIQSLVTKLRICKLWAKKTPQKTQREPLLTLNIQKFPSVGCESRVFWALATRRSLWLHHLCSQASLGPCRLSPTLWESCHLRHLPLLLACLLGLSSFPDAELAFRLVSSPLIVDFTWAPRDRPVTLALFSACATSLLRGLSPLPLPQFCPSLSSLLCSQTQPLGGGEYDPVPRPVI